MMITQNDDKADMMVMEHKNTVESAPSTSLSLVLNSTEVGIGKQHHELRSEDDLGSDDVKLDDEKMRRGLPDDVINDQGVNMLRSEAGLMNTEVKIEACPEPPSDDKLSVNEIHTRGDVDEQVAECVYKRGGWCYTHKMYGDKSVKKWSVWGQKRDGTFGYLSRSSTNYSCRKNSAVVYRPDIAIRSV